MNSKTFCLGDPHGGHKAMLQCFKRSGFNKDNDKLICIGDVVDGWPETPECIETLLSIKHLVYIMGNHDVWCHEWFQYGNSPTIWLSQGGLATITAYQKNPELLIKHKDFFTDKPFYYIKDNRLFVHGGFHAMWPIDKTTNYDMTWNRGMWERALATKKISAVHHERDRNISMYIPRIKDYKDIFIGHTTTSKISDKPIKALNIWNVDQGAGWEGKLSIMNVETKEFFQSDKVSTLYPGIQGRG